MLPLPNFVFHPMPTTTTTRRGAGSPEVTLGHGPPFPSSAGALLAEVILGQGLPSPAHPTSFGRPPSGELSVIEHHSMLLTINELVSSGGSTSLFVPLVISPVTFLIILPAYSMSLSWSFSLNIIFANLTVICFALILFNYLIIFQVIYPVTFLINSLFTFFSFFLSFPIPNLCHILPGDITARWLAYGHSRSTIIYAHTLPWVSRLPAVART